MYLPNLSKIILEYLMTQNIFFENHQYPDNLFTIFQLIQLAYFHHFHALLIHFKILVGDKMLCVIRDENRTWRLLEFRRQIE